MSSYKVPFEGTEDYQNILAEFLAHLNALETNRKTLSDTAMRLMYEQRKERPKPFTAYTAIIHAGYIWQCGHAADQFLSKLRAYRAAYEAQE